jgi:hypothetical protein
MPTVTAHKLLEEHDAAANGEALEPYPSADQGEVLGTRKSVRTSVHFAFNISLESGKKKTVDVLAQHAA